ncbi:MAG: SRPBCC domain-containing protein [Candidatus Binatus sp.]|uniref:SRPBCC family protein n=1 Tax=Candidatus Binatus sp. TaxID=2811406 RepID=UPI00271D309F|nr:SRPBCC domain-containing protein [Candidatus Binatus sp.]MDO8433271.1 SRPBCC domain-containing protein [Candidatus Binatus sp.]
MEAQSNLATEPAGRILVITRTFDAPRSLVFKAWTEREHLVQWFGPRDFKVISCEMDVRTGGILRVHSRSPQGSDHYLQGVYREIVPPRRLVSTYAWSDAQWKPTRPETLLTLTFEEEQGSKTRLTLHQGIFESITARDLHRGGWSESLDLLAAHIMKAR